MQLVQFVKKSANAKTGPMPTTNSQRSTCPAVCPLKRVWNPSTSKYESPCYAESGFHTKLNWNKLDSGERGGTFDALINKVETMTAPIWRHNVSGDFYHVDEVMDRGQIRRLTRANGGRRVISFTHHDMSIKANRVTVAAANRDGFTINLSGNNIDHADDLMALNIAPVVAIVPVDQTSNFKSPAGHNVVICPATYKDDVTCTSCQMCSKQRSTIIAFPAHGAAKNQIKFK